MKTLLIFLVIAAAWGYAAAQDTPSTTQSMQSKVQGDTSVTGFIMKAMKSSEKEIKAGQLALEKAQGTAVKDYAARMVKDHSEAIALLKTIAAKKNLTLAPMTETGGAAQTGTSQATATGAQQTAARIGTSAEKNTTTSTNTTGSPTTKAWAEAKEKSDHPSMLGTLSQKSGAEFDREYMRMMVQGHIEAVSLFEQAASSRDADIKNFATNTLPVLRDHLQSAQTILGSLK
ncbi:DUF4142 domain-containing protein [Flavihumibacter sp. R14]|nr:DUF4142 domain-containing protein [Flavihumibacter soli]